MVDGAEPAGRPRRFSVAAPECTPYDGPDGIKPEDETVVTIYHNPRCSKSRAALKLLREHGIEPEIIEYLKTPPDAVALDGFLKKLKIEPRQLMRRGEAPYTTLDLADRKKSRAELIDAMVSNPILIERPIIVNKGKVALGRPPEAVLGIV